MNVTLPEVGSSYSVTNGEEWETNGALIVDTSNIVLYVTSSNEDGTFYAGESIFIEVRAWLNAEMNRQMVSRECSLVALGNGDVAH